MSGRCGRGDRASGALAGQSGLLLPPQVGVQGPSRAQPVASGHTFPVEPPLCCRWDVGGLSLQPNFGVSWPLLWHLPVWGCLFPPSLPGNGKPTVKAALPRPRPLPTLGVGLLGENRPHPRFRCHAWQLWGGDVVT